MTTGRTAPTRLLTERPARKTLARHRWNIDSFDGALADGHDSSTAALIRRYLGSRGRAG